jgi:hypothetical protein
MSKNQIKDHEIKVKAQSEKKDKPKSSIHKDQERVYICRWVFANTFSIRVESMDRCG